MWMVIVAPAVLVVLSLVIVASRGKKTDKTKQVTPRPCPEDCRPCPFCGAPVRRKAKKCLYCGADIQPDFSESFGGVALAPEAFEQVTSFVNNLNDDDAIKYLRRNFGLDEAKALSAIDLYKSENPDLIKRPNWTPWVVSVFIVVVIIILLVL